MSVIFGIIENEKIIIAGDKRLSSIEGKFISDDGQKWLQLTIDWQLLQQEMQQ